MTRRAGWNAGSLLERLPKTIWVRDLPTGLDKKEEKVRSVIILSDVIQLPFSDVVLCFWSDVICLHVM